jgi:hypothetical protein
MPKKDLQDFRTTLADILREVSLTVRLGILAGMAAGLLAAYLVLGQVPDEPAQLTRLVERRVAFPFFTYTGIGLLAAGGFLGCAAGVLIELAVQRLRNPPAERPPPPPREPLGGWRPGRRG